MGGTTLGLDRAEEPGDGDGDRACTAVLASCCAATSSMMVSRRAKSFPARFSGTLRPDQEGYVSKKMRCS